MQFSLLEWLINSSIIIKIIIFILVMCSIFSWSIIFSKTWQLKQLNLRYYLNSMSLDPNLNTIYNNIPQSSKNYAENLIYTVINTYKVFLEKHKSNNESNNIFHINTQHAIENIERSSNIKIEEQINKFSNGLVNLSSIANISPYIGLLGTVIGIMHTFLNLNESNNIQQIAPSIAESLIVTALGLLVAIPASFAYNYFADKVNLLQNNSYLLKDKIINLLTK